MSWGMLGWLKSAVLVVVRLECWWHIQHGVHLKTGLLQLMTTTYIYSICVLYGYIYIACVQICIFISWRCHFIGRSPINILPLPYVPPSFMGSQNIQVVIVYRDVLMVCATYPTSVGYFSVILFIHFLFLFHLFFSFPGFNKSQDNSSLYSAFTRSSSAIRSIFECFISSYFSFI